MDSRNHITTTTLIRPVATLTATALLAISLGICTSAFAIPLLHRKKPPAQNYLPALRLSPTITPEQTDGPADSKSTLPPADSNLILPKKLNKTGKPESQVIESPSSQATQSEPSDNAGVVKDPAKPDQNPTDAPVNKTAIPTPPAAPPPDPQILVGQLVKLKLFPESLENNPAPITRSEWASILAKSLNHNLQMVETFPVYRDVPVTDPNYAPIEVLREKKIMTFPGSKGYFEPNKPVTRAEVFLHISRAISGQILSPEIQKDLLATYTDHDDLAPETSQAAAKMARVRFFTPEAGYHESVLRPNDTITATELAPLVNYLLNVLQDHVLEDATLAKNAQFLPAGLNLTLTPSTAVFEAQMTPGQSINFSLVNEAPPLARDSRIQGVVRESLNSHVYVLVLQSARTPDNRLYKMRAPLQITFPVRRRNSFIITGQNFTSVTEADGSFVPVSPSSLQNQGKATSVTPVKPGAKPAASKVAPTTVAPTTAPANSPMAAPPIDPPNMKQNQLPEPGQGSNRPGVIPDKNTEEAPKALPAVPTKANQK